MTGRLDAELAARGLARSRTAAARFVEEGLVTVNGRPVVKPSASVSADDVLAVAAADHYVSRAAHKLLAALDAFAVDVAGRTALDLGASTGGFTQVLRERGADPVVALDVGHGQLAASVALDPGVVGVQGVNARDLTPASLAAASDVVTPPGVVTADLSFIPLRLVLPAIRAVAADDADVIVLIKPQFEVGRAGVKEGLVTDAGLRADAVAQVLWSAWDAGYGTAGLIASPIAGTHGNREYLAHLAVGRGTAPDAWRGEVDALTR